MTALPAICEVKGGDLGVVLGELGLEPVSLELAQVLDGRKLLLGGDS